jgi:hypothetical protein
MDFVGETYANKSTDKHQYKTDNKTDSIDTHQDINDVKTVSIAPAPTSKQIVMVNKPKRTRVEVVSWAWSEDDLLHANQLRAINTLTDVNKLTDKLDPYTTAIQTHIQTKLRGYREQDKRHDRYSADQFISLADTQRLLVQSELKCHYCDKEVYLLYSWVMDGRQWSLDRIDNDHGHNRDNVVISCLTCNLHRRRTNYEGYHFTRKLVVVQLGK